MKRLFLSMLLLCPLFLSAQQTDSLSRLRKMLDKKSMIVLGGWASANIISGSIAYPNTSGSIRYFHQMNFFWNIANLGIASLHLLAKDEETTSLSEELKIQRKTEKLFLINSALDVGYIATGIYLHQRGKNKSSDRMNGYGKSIIVQGAFLLAFDGFMYKLNQKNRRKISRMIDNASLGFTGNGFGLSVALK